MKISSILLIFIFLFAGCKNEKFTTINDGVVFNFDKNKMKLQVCSEDIIKVSYTANDDFSTKKSLITGDKIWDAVPFKVENKDNSVEITTSKLKAIVKLESGQVQFYDSENNLLLQEKNDGGKTITPDEFNGEKIFNIKQEFETSANEALYGLGQHHHRLLNIKGYDIDLFQHNTEVYVPLLVSSKGYGILWDNNSHTKFGNPDSVVTIATEQLINNKNESGQLSVQYFSDSTFKQPINIEIPNAASNLSLDKDAPIKSAILSGYLLANKTGEHSIYTYADGNFKCWIDDELILDNWAPYANARDMARVNLTKGTKHKIKIEWSKYYHGNSFQLKWREPNNSDQFISLWSKSGTQIDYYFMAGKNIDNVISNYRTITGTAPMMPKWAMGFWQCRERYKTQNELLAITKEFRDRKVPLDVIVQDWQYWKVDAWGSHVFDETRFPDFKAAIDELHNSLNTKLMISVWGKFYTGSQSFNELNEKGWLYQQPLKDSIVDFMGYHYTYYDAFNPDARKLYWSQINERLFSKGVDAWWLDATEPELPENPNPEIMATYMNPTYNGSGVDNLNAFPLMTNRAVYEGQREAAPDQRVCILTRSAFAGQQKYATTVWSGDISGRWDVLKASIPAGLGLCLSGFPYWTTDIGGFWVQYPEGNKNEEYRELFTRWYQYGSFCPIFRVHGSSTEREIWYFGDKSHKAYQTQLKFNKLRYRLMPYIYSLTGMVTHSNYTIMRALVMDFASDNKVLDIDNQFMFGPAMLINPVSEYKATSRSVYLPASAGWYDFWTGSFYDGAQTIVADAPYESMPIFIKAGSIIPMGPNLQYATEKPADPIELRVYTGDNASFVLYEDENDNNNYEKGMFSNIEFKWNEVAQELSIGERIGKFEGMINNRVFNIVFVNRENKKGGDLVLSPNKIVQYSGQQINVKQ